jgi:ribose 5-phosphate isomerase B
MLTAEKGRKRGRNLKPIKIVASSDHAGLKLRKVLVKGLRDRGVEVEDLGPDSAEPIDYPDEAAKVGHRVGADGGQDVRGLLVCASGVGMCMAANKIDGVRAVDAWSVESARLSRAHNDANVLCLGERLLSEADATAILDAWLVTPFEGGRHARRVAKVDHMNDVAPRAAGSNSR